LAAYSSPSLSTHQEKTAPKITNPIIKSYNTTQHDGKNVLKLIGRSQWTKQCRKLMNKRTEKDN